MELEGVDGDQDAAHIRVDVAGVEALAQVLEQCRFIEVCSAKDTIIVLWEILIKQFTQFANNNAYLAIDTGPGTLGSQAASETE